MDAYLDIAKTVLRSEKRPMTPRAILALAYKAGIVSHHLHGKTQHKTLGARLSEDVLKRNDRSLFFRPASGKFFLREFLTDSSIPEEYRNPVPTRRRFRELVQGSALALDKSSLSNFERDRPIDIDSILKLLQTKQCRYEDPRHRSEHLVFFRAFVCVRRGAQILTYRLGRFREDRDTFMQKKSVGFATLVHDFAHTLFDEGDLGIIESGIHATKIDLDIPDTPNTFSDEGKRAHLLHFIWPSARDGGDLLAVINYDCPPWFEPTKRRLALNDVSWLDNPDKINDIEDFDPWSKQVLEINSEFQSSFAELRKGGTQTHSG